MSCWALSTMRTPLATMRTAIDVTLDGNQSRTELHAMITDVSAAVDASQHTLDGLLALARSQAGSIRREHLDLAGTAADPIEQARAEAQLFQPFVRGAGARVRSGGGAGLGLSIVDAITTAHDGTIASGAPPTGGLDITIELPRPS